MRLYPSFEEFAETYDKGEPQAVWTRLIADLETPVSAMLKLGADKPMSFLLESVEGGAVRGRYSVIGFEPDIIWRAFGDEAEINRAPARSPGKFAKCKGGTLAALRDLLAESRMALPTSLPPMALGVFGYMGYDTVRLIEKLPKPNRDPIGIPDAVLIRPTVMAIFDNVKDEITVVTPVRPQKRVAAGTAYSRALDRLSSVVDALDAPLSHGAAPNGAHLDYPKTTSNTTPKQYETMVKKAKEYIAAGDIFQVVLSQRFSAPFDLPPFALYRALRRVNPSPFLYYLNFGGFSVAGSSPEILVRARGGEVTIRPIAGTRRRGETPDEDKRLADDLLSDEKERSEHLMLLDLGRNDVGRVAKLGTVRVHRQLLPRILQPGDAHRLECGRRAWRRARCGRRIDGGLSGRHRVGGAEGARHGDHRRAGEGKARALCRLRRLFLRDRRDG